MSFDRNREKFTNVNNGIVLVTLVNNIIPESYGFNEASSELVKAILLKINNEKIE